MKQKKLHIVSFDVPFPPDYGGVMDVFYRLKALSEAGFIITLHCFEYGRGRHSELKKYAHHVHYYKRGSKVLAGFRKTPMIVASRANTELLKRLCEDSSPILFEGQHCTAFLDHAALQKRVKLVRIHNVEHEYYKELSKVEKSLLKKRFFMQESKKLAQHEKVLKSATALLCISSKEQVYYSDKSMVTDYLPVSFPLNFLVTDKKKNFTLFHGNLSVPENENTVLWLLNNVASKLNHPLYVAGKNPTKRIQEAAENKQRIHLVANPSKEELQELLKQAKTHLMWTSQNTGVKLKLLHTLTTNGAVVVNSAMIEGTELNHLCTQVKTEEELISFLNGAPRTPIDSQDMEMRRTCLAERFGGDRVSETILKYLE